MMVAPQLLPTLAEATRAAPNSERRLPQLSAKAAMLYKTICFRSRRMRPLFSPLAHYGDCGIGRAVSMYPITTKNREVMHENAAA